MMDKNDKFSECLSLKVKIKIFIFGVVIGCFGGLLWQEVLSPIEIYPSLSFEQETNILRSETDEKLLKYIEGKWRSSIGDLIIEIKDSEINGSFIVIENISIKPKHQEKFKVVNIDKLDGLLGIVRLNLCNINSECSDKDLIPIQINKIFGVDKAITMTYDVRFAYCVEPNESCTRAFKEID